MTPSRLLTPKQLGELIGLSTSTLAKLRLTTHGPKFRKLGVAVRYDEADVAMWLEAHPPRSSTSDIPQSAA